MSVGVAGREIKGECVGGRTQSHTKGEHYIPLLEYMLQVGVGQPATFPHPVSVSMKPQAGEKDGVKRVTSMV